MFNYVFTQEAYVPKQAKLLFACFQWKLRIQIPFDSELYVYMGIDDTYHLSWRHFDWSLWMKYVSKQKKNIYSLIR